MPTTLKFRRGSTSFNDGLTLEAGELFLDTAKNTLVVHDGVNAGGTAISTENYVDSSLGSVIGNAPNDLNTLQEIANAIDNDADFSNTVQNQLDNKVSFTDLSATGDLNYDSSTGVFSVTTYKSSDFSNDFSQKSTSDLSEGSNLYYTDSRVDSHLSGGTGVTYTTGTIEIGQSVGTADDVAFNSVTLGSAPSSNSDATTKSYVDSVAQGIITRPSARAATTQNLDATYSAGTLTANANGAFAVDDVTGWSVGEEVVVKDQTDATENGIYVVNQTGDASNPYILERAEFMDESSEVAGSFVFVREGTDNANTGWTFSVDDAATFTLDTDEIDVNQFSGAGSFTAGDGLTLAGSEFSVNVGDGIEIASNALRLPSSLAGNGLNYASGVLSTDLSVFSTTDLQEGSRLYYTDARANSAIDTRVTKAFVDALDINSDQLDGEDGSYYLNYNNLNNTPTNLSEFSNDTDYVKLTDFSAAGDLTYDNVTGEFSVTTYKTANFNTDFDSKTTDDLTEGTTNLFYTDSKIDAYVSGGTGVTYNSGEISIGQSVAPTDNVEFDNIVANGGITFGGTATSDNTLADYEQGTWSPEFDSVNAGTQRSTTVFFGEYTKIGRMVYCRFSAELATIGTGGSGQFIIRGLPFAGSGEGYFMPVFFENLKDSVVYMSGAVQVGSGNVLVSILPAAGTSMEQAPLFDTYVQEGTRIDGTVVYSVE